MSKNNGLCIRLSAILIALTLSNTASAAEDYGVFERIHQSASDFDVTVESVKRAFENSSLTLHADHEIRVPDKLQQAHIFVLTSPAYRLLAANEAPRTISAQVLRVAVYSWGEDQQVLINMANPVSHAMVFYANSPNYDAMISGAVAASAEIRDALAELAGEPVSEQQEPLRSEKHYRKYKGDGPARMMAKFRTFADSQLLIEAAYATSIGAATTAIGERLAEVTSASTSEPDGWDELVRIPFSDDAVYFGLSNAYIEDKMIRINSRFRDDGKSDTAPFPGVDHVAALPTDVLVIKEDDEVKILHYGQMWRMQLYFWDSGYRAFTANVGVPGSIVNSIEDLLEQQSD